MRLYYATVDLWISERHDSEHMCVPLHFLMESQFGHEVRDAKAIAQLNAPFGKVLHAVEFRSAGTVELPARISVPVTNRSEGA